MQSEINSEPDKKLKTLFEQTFSDAVKEIFKQRFPDGKNQRRGYLARRGRNKKWRN